MVETGRGREARAGVAPGRRHEGPGQWLDAIAPEECWQLLAPRRLGRIGFTAHSGRPVILPVNYCVSDHKIVIRSARGPKLEAAGRGDLVAFEVDELDVVARTGWSVSITGRARWVRDPRELARLAKVDVEPWVAGDRDEVIVINPMHVAGRRLAAPTA
jgi:nitroimidazol reductase NimA-like FMN-containing flavoprotein (pyridoxamine 5'-phosphate oxidase superfamily)